MAQLGLEAAQVALPERVAVGLPAAGVGYRCLAYLVDVLILFLFWVLAYFIYSLAVTDVWGVLSRLSSFAVTLTILGAFATQWVYWTLSEVVLRGQTLGKRALRIRVVREDGSPVGPLESAIRNLCRAVDFLPAFYMVGLCTMLLTRRHLRLGDLAAGTLLVREEQIDLSRYETTPREADTAAGLTSLTLTTEQTELVLDFLERARELEAAPRQRLGGALLRKVAGSLAPEQLETALRSSQDTEALLRGLVQGRPE